MGDFKILRERQLEPPLSYNEYKQIAPPINNVNVDNSKIQLVEDFIASDFNFQIFKLEIEKVYPFNSIVHYFSSGTAAQKQAVLGIMFRYWEDNKDSAVTKVKGYEDTGYGELQKLKEKGIPDNSTFYKFSAFIAFIFICLLVYVKQPKKVKK